MFLAQQTDSFDADSECRGFPTEIELKRLPLLIAVFAIGMFVHPAHAQVVRQSVDGITNLALIETTVACAGAITPESVTEIGAMGFRSIINLRQASESGANVEAEEAAARAADINYFHIPFNGSSPDPATVDRFVDVITDTGTEPAFIHCAGGNRAAAMWFVKRTLVDRWDSGPALAEATELGFRAGALRDFMTNYVEAHR